MVISGGETYPIFDTQPFGGTQPGTNDELARMETELKICRAQSAP